MMASVEVLSPAESALFISENAVHVKINKEGIEKLCKEIKCSMINNKLTMPDVGSEAVHFPKDFPRPVDWVFVCDTLNFCFWSHSDSPSWTVNGHTGYYALEAALQRAIKEGVDMTQPAVYGALSEESARRVFRGDAGGAVEPPQMLARMNALKEAGSELRARWGGTFAACVASAGGSARSLVRLVVERFPSYRDEAVYSGCRVAFYKRAQILAADLWTHFKGEGPGAFDDIDELTMFADYRVPQVLLHFGALSYSRQLMDKLKNEEELPAGSAEEVEIRGCSVRCVELVRRALADHAEPPLAIELDYWLWLYRRRHADRLHSVPFHRTLSVYY